MGVGGGEGLETKLDLPRGKIMRVGRRGWITLEEDCSFSVGPNKAKQHIHLS